MSYTKEQIARALKDHYLTGIQCQHEAKTDRSFCWCGSFQSAPQPSIGEAVDRWIEHVLAELEGHSACSSPDRARTLLEMVEREWQEVDGENSGLLWQIRDFLGMKPDHVTGAVHRAGDVSDADRLAPDSNGYFTVAIPQAVTQEQIDKWLGLVWTIRPDETWTGYKVAKDGHEWQWTIWRGPPQFQGWHCARCLRFGGNHPAPGAGLGACDRDVHRECTSGGKDG